MECNENHINKIQKIWRLYLIRKKIKYFSQLPNELWYLIVDKLNNKYYHQGIDLVIENKK